MNNINVSRGLIGRLFMGLVLGLLLLSCGSSGRPLNEQEQALYDEALAEYDKVKAQIIAVNTSTSDAELNKLIRQIRRLSYSQDLRGLNEEVLVKCNDLALQIANLQESCTTPEALLTYRQRLSEGTTGDLSEAMLINKNEMLLEGLSRFPIYLLRGDSIQLSLKSEQEGLQLTVYNMDKEASLAQWKGSRLTESVAIPNSAIYMVELSAPQSSARTYVDLSVVLLRGEKDPRSISESWVKCQRGDFLARQVEEIETVPLFDEPRKVGLRSQLKALFSGNKRVVIPLNVPSGVHELVYSLRISTNEQTQSGDGQFNERFLSDYHQVKLFGLTAYESTRSNDFIDKVLFNTRPPREEDAFCNMYVFHSQREAKKFQDTPDGAVKFNYDVDRSQMGTQSCNGRIPVKAKGSIYLGFENAKVRYDNYIWLEVLGLRKATKYYKLKYTLG